VLLECHHLRKIYTTPRGEIPAVDGIDLQIQPGEFLAICGRSGSGKSTLLGMIGGLCRPSAGSVRIDAVDLWALRPGPLTEFRARRIGFLFQFAGLLPSLRAIDNIAVPALLAGASYELAYARARGLLGQFGLRDRWDAYPNQLSGGQQRRVALARALVNEPLVLLADEPTNDLDEQAEHEIVEVLHDLRRQRHTTVIVVTHDPQLARQADRILYVRSGKLAKVGVHELVPRTEPAQSASIPLASVPEPATPSLVPAEPTPLGAGLGRFLVGLIGWALLILGGLWSFDYATAWWQRQAVEAKQAGRKQAQELALQQLRADLEDVLYRPEGNYEVRLYLQNFDTQKPFYVLGPSVRVFVQSNRTWQELPASAVGFSDNTVHAVTNKEVFRIAFRADVDRYDELLKGYMHVRITNVMVVSENAEPTEDLFQRTDDYYIYLKPHKVSEDEVRKRNGWKEGALVPRWMGMPAH
jgi:putative ABC transport system ATP-binding protein/macrolide transport system ATP-binding/permease protein/lipoprotein-releasing system ATP-binding protein